MLRRRLFPCFDFRGSVVPNLESTDKFAAIRELVNKTSAFRDVKDNPAFLEAVFCRERECSTGFGHGVAVAHAKTDCVKKMEIALGISHKGIEFNAIDGCPVSLLFLIATPVDKTERYLKLLAVLMTVVRESDLREKLLTLDNAEEIESLLDTRFQLCYKRKNLDVV